MEEVLNQMHYDGTLFSKFLNKTLLFDKTGRSSNGWKYLFN